MVNLVLSYCLQNLRWRQHTILRCYHVGKAGSVHTAIQRGIRKSKGMAFRGKVKPTPDDPREKYRLKHSIPKYTPPDPNTPPPYWKSKPVPAQTEVRIRKGAILISGKESPVTNSRISRSGTRESRHNLRAQDNSRGRQIHAERETFPERAERRSAVLSPFKPQRPESQLEFAGRSLSRTSNGGPRISPTIDNQSHSPPRGPISIPYTTPASEFLYGTSVVEAALMSRKEPRRQLYKLYIYSGENRKGLDQDSDIESLARKTGVPVVYGGNDWLRVMDKMSGGRPHNGYILEASSLPKLPVTSLGPLQSRDGQEGFIISVDYQSREEAAVNGSSDFVKIPRGNLRRNPLVLYLDSIVDPGNLGSILRSASFFGATAVAISTRNTAPFSPVVLKASAGASENITLFTVNKPAAFIVDSKNAGWKVFAAVAPSKKNDLAMPISISTDELDDPLSEQPCILMLGNEGEGLRWNLRSKADADLYIQGGNTSNTVDSLNVSIAAGILCNAFLKKGGTRLLSEKKLLNDEVVESKHLFNY